MSTSLILLGDSQRTIPPARVPHILGRLNGIAILDGQRLRQLVELEIITSRALRWEEWYDVRRHWCGAYACKSVELAKGCRGLELEQRTCAAVREGYEYILLEEV